MDLTGRVRVDKGAARITATIWCNEPLVLDASLELVQTYKQNIFRSDQFIEYPCSRTPTRIAIVFRPTNGLFGAGTAKIRVDALTRDGV